MNRKMYLLISTFVFLAISGQEPYAFPKLIDAIGNLNHLNVERILGQAVFSKDELICLFNHAQYMVATTERKLHASCLNFHLGMPAELCFKNKFRYKLQQIFSGCFWSAAACTIACELYHKATSKKSFDWFVGRLLGLTGAGAIGLITMYESTFGPDWLSAFKKAEYIKKLIQDALKKKLEEFPAYPEVSYVLSLLERQDTADLFLKTES